MNAELEEMRVLIVDDSLIVRKAIRKAVRAAGVSDAGIREAPNGRDAIDQLDSDPADVVFLDINMPVMDGMEFMESMNAAGRVSDHYIVVVSTDVNAKRLLRMASLGARARLKKPFESERLQGLITEAFNERKSA